GPPLSVGGFAAAATRLPRPVPLFRRPARELDPRPPHVLVCVDLPDWNALLARVARRRGVPTLAFVAPQVWAWRPRRARSLAGLVSNLIVLFPSVVRAQEAAREAVAC